MINDLILNGLECVLDTYGFYKKKLSSSTVFLFISSFIYLLFFLGGWGVGGGGGNGLLFPFGRRPRTMHKNSL